MALPTSTNRAVVGMMPSNAIVGQREDLSDMIRDVSPEGYSFLEMVKDGPAPESVMYEWQMDVKRKVSTASADDAKKKYYDYAVAEGSAPDYGIPNQPIRVANVVQISREDISETGTAEWVNKAGRRDELARQIDRAIQFMKERIEYSLWRRGYPVNTSSDWTTRNPSAIPTTAAQTIRRMGGIKAFMRTNVDTALGSGKSIPALTTGLPIAPTAADAETLLSATGAARPFHEQLLQKLTDKMFNNRNGDAMLQAYMGTFTRRKWSRMAGIVRNQHEITGDLKPVMKGSADVYMDENFTLIGNTSRYIDPADLALMDWPEFEMCWARPLSGGFHPPNGRDARFWGALAEFGFRIFNEASCGWIGKLTTS